MDQSADAIQLSDVNVDAAVVAGSDVTMVNGADFSYNAESLLTDCNLIFRYYNIKINI